MDIHHSNMRIAFISGMSGYPSGGSEVLWSQTAHRLLGGGHQILTSSKRWPHLPEHIARLREAGATTKLHRPRKATRRALIAAKLLRKAVKHPGFDADWLEITDFKPDLVCISHGGISCGIEWMLRCLNAGIPYVSVSQANSEMLWPSDDHADNLIAAHCGAMRSYFVSARNRDLFECQSGIQLTNSEVVRNPYNVSRDTKLAWPNDDRVLRMACVGRLHPPSKGQDLLCAVMAQEKWRTRPVEISLYGEGPCAEGLRRLVSTLKLQDHVLFKGHVHNVAEIWTQHHALLLPSRYEGLPLALVEAMMCGRAAISTDVAGVKEVLEDKITGFIAAAPTVDLLDEAMERAWQARSELASIGNKAAGTIRQIIPEDPAQVFANKLLALTS